MLQPLFQHSQHKLFENHFLSHISLHQDATRLKIFIDTSQLQPWCCWNSSGMALHKNNAINVYSACGTRLCKQFMARCN